MKTLTALSVCALFALSAPVLAQTTSGAMKKDMQQNGSPSGASPSHAKQPGDAGAESGKAPNVTEGRSSATDSNGMNGATK